MLIQQLSKHLYFVIIIFALLFVYEPILTGHYIYHDDLMIYDWNHKDLTHHPLYSFFVKSGRFLAAIITSFLFSFVYNIKDLSMIYVGTFCVLLLCAWFIYRSLIKSTPLLWAALFTILITCLPPFQAILSWATACIQLIAVLAAILSATLIISTSHQLFYRGLSVVLLFLALCIHQQAAMFYWVIATLELLALYQQRGWQNLIKGIYHFTAIFILTLLFYIPFMYASFYFYPGELTLIYNTHAINTDIINRLLWFLTQPFYHSLNLWLYPPTIMVSFLVLLLFLFNIYRMIQHHQQFHQNQQGLWIIFFALIVIFLSYFPVFISHYQYVCYRNSIAMTPLILIFLLWPLTSSSPYRAIPLTIFTIMICFYSHHTINDHLVLPREKETTYVIDKFKSAQPPFIYAIQITHPEIRKITADDYDYQTFIFHDRILPLLYAGLIESGHSPSAWGKDFLLDANKSIQETPGAIVKPLVFDFNEVVLPSNNLQFK